MMRLPTRPAFSKDSGVVNAAVQNGGRGVVVGRGSEVTFLKL